MVPAGRDFTPPGLTEGNADEQQAPGRTGCPLCRRALGKLREAVPSAEPHVVTARDASGHPTGGPWTLARRTEAQCGPPTQRGFSLSQLMSQESCLPHNPKFTSIF